MVTTLDSVCSHRVIPVVVVDSVAAATTVATGLAAGGLPVAEVTFRTPAALDAIRAMVDRGDVLVGAGTVLTPEQVDDAVRAGAQFVVSPGTSRAVLERAGEHGVPAVPGAVTATEIQAARELGARTVKFFPAESSGGVAALRALAAPFSDMRFIPTGGVAPGNIRDYLDVDQVRAVGGSWMLPAAAVATDDVETIRRLTAEAVRVSGGMPH